ncbi:hypothetical protein RJ641_007963 [Dillenia turbinata]|uniref:Uncharacterized protein n=1 Tax=Dillenia turbinata TaxID=194707 RepID=A0AAN8V405_9MAGN
MFVKDGKTDWDCVIDAEARRRKILEPHPEESTNEEPVLFRSSIIPWWTWLKRSYLPEVELLNGRAAMVGFFMAYVVDASTGLDLVGRTGNLVCKAGLFDLNDLKKVDNEATSYDKQWQATWLDQSVNPGDSGQDHNFESLKRSFEPKN